MIDFMSKKESRRSIIELKLPNIVLEVFDAKPLPYDLDIQFCDPYICFTREAAMLARGRQSEITPLWKGHSNCIVVAFHHNPTRKGFFRFDVECGKERQPIGLNWQQILVKEFQLLWESDMPESQLKEVAGWFDFRHTEMLISELSTAHLTTFEKEAVWYETFIRKLEG